MEAEQKIKFLSRLISGLSVFAGMVAVLLLLNHYQMSKQDPIESAAIAALVERLDGDSNNAALKEEIRQLDLLARKAYFTSAWQVKTGAFILLFAGIVLGILLKLYFDLKARIELPENPEPDDQRARKNSVRWIWAIGGFIFIAALTSAYLSQDQLANYDEYKLAELKKEEAQVVEDDGIEVIEVARSASENTSENTSVNTNTSENANENTSVNTSENTSVNTSENTSVNTSVNTSANTNTSGDTLGVTIAATPGATPGDYEPWTSNHPSFRGFWGNGVSSHKKIPTSWDGAAGTNVLWKVPVPRHGYNSPVIWGDKLFLAGGDNEVREVFCFNKNTGAIIWHQEVKDIEGSPAAPPKVTSDTGLSAPTVSTDGQKVFAIFGTGDLIAFDFSGKRLWARNMGVPDNHYGHSSSLINWDGKLVVLYDTNRGGKIMALNTQNGQTIWEQSRPNRISWSSPVLAEIAGKMVILTTTDPLVAAHDLNTGEELWSVECLMGEVGASAAYGSGLVFGANEYARLVGIKPGSTPEIVWENDEYLPEVASPVESEGLLFIGTSYGVFACYNALTGEKHWEHEANQGYYASPLIADGKVYAIDMDGVMHIFAVSKELQVIGEPALGEKAVASPAFDNGRIYLRGDQNLYCIGGK